MVSGLRYRLASITATMAMVIVGTFLANTSTLQETVISIPLFSSLTVTTYAGTQFTLILAVTLTIVTLWCLPLFRPKPSRGIETFGGATKRIVYALVSLAAIGYIDYTYALPRLALISLSGILLVTIPMIITLLRNAESEQGWTRIVVGDDHKRIESLIENHTEDLLGYVAPVSRYSDQTANATNGQRVLADGFGNYSGTDSDEVKHLGGLPRLEEVLVEQDVDRALLAFKKPDRGDFFGALQTCHDNGVVAEVERTYENLVLTESSDQGLTQMVNSESIDSEFVEINLEPWDSQDRLLKRAFDITFATTALLVTLPLTIAIAIAIKLDSPGQVFFAQDRTFQFGGTFKFYKFRSMIENAEDETGVTISEEDAGGVDPRVTRVGRFLRKTHLDEIPQLWSVLVGDMSVVGPRPAQTEIEHEFESGVPRWPQRWFVKPGLTGLAQIRGVTGLEPEEKLQSDIEYIHRQSFTLDVRIVARELYDVFSDAIDAF